MVSLAGIPPTGGFWAKFFIFTAAIERGGLGPWLAVIMVLNSVASLYYYVAVAKEMVLVEPVVDRPLASPALVSGVVVLATVTILAIGVYPQPFAHLPTLSTLVGR
ncbi:MAG TPA: NADH-quinone oxidoreductase subunit N, partial [Actinomycetota bacterium]|nr:NADH-quinone oxidoreductase subunit N [Actinomycetota bacterium]